MTLESTHSPVCPVCSEPWKRSHQCTTGATLAGERVAAKLTKAEVARRMNVSKQYLGRIELQLHPSGDIKKRYRAAIQGVDT